MDGEDLPAFVETREIEKECTVQPRAKLWWEFFDIVGGGQYEDR